MPVREALNPKLLTARTARFTEVVNTSGEPELVDLWTEPSRDKPFMSAVRKNRVMTVKQETVGSRKDFGLVGFHPGKNSAYLVFPKPLTRFQNRRIIGIKYDLLKNPQPVGPRVEPLKKTSRLRGRLEPAVKSELEKTFRVSIRFTTTADVTEEVEAASRKSAVEKALQQVRLPNLTRSTVTRKVIKVGEAD